MIVKNVEKKEDNTLTFQVESDAAEFEAAVNAAYLKNKHSINIPGFRKGKAPRAVVEGMYGAEVFYQDAMDELAPKAFEQGVTENDVKFVGAPSIVDVNVTDDKTVAYTFSVTLYPEVTLGQYKGLSAERYPAEVDEDEIGYELEAARKRNSRKVDVEREAQMGDVANIDFDGYLNGERFDGGKAEAYDLELGSGSFVPGFEEQIVGMNIGDEKDIDITFPENYHADLAGKAVVFKVKVHEVKEKEVPAMDDEFAKDVSEFDTLKDLKADLKKKITEERQKDADRVFEENLMNQVAENITADIPDVMVENQAHQYLDNFKAQISRQFPYEEYKKMTGMDDAKLLEEAKEPALRQVKMDLATAAIIKAENIEASDEDVEAEFAKMAEQFGMDVEMVKKYLSKEQVHDQILTQKAVAVVVDSATAEKPAKKTAKKAETAEGEEEKPAKKTIKKAETVEGEEKPKKAPAKKAAKKEEKEAE